jgi:hypothetical protein
MSLTRTSKYPSRSKTARAAAMIAMRVRSPLAEAPDEALARRFADVPVGAWPPRVRRCGRFCEALGIRPLPFCCSQVVNNRHDTFFMSVIDRKGNGSLLILVVTAFQDVNSAG